MSAMDLFDRAQEADSKFLAMALNQHAKKTARRSSVSRTACIDCEVLIPEARRTAVPGCERCIDCEEIFEAIRRR